MCYGTSALWHTFGFTISGFSRSPSQAILTTSPPLVNLISRGPDSDSPQFAFVLDATQIPVKSLAVAGLQVLWRLRASDRAF
ncbi:hypothetical protein QUB37_04010 [Microcoleus sp. AT3-A2]|uniref:hypothetical protein n=1 Tax=unclassified Microcoleus TaxID=2642155 RepID=UPI002FCE7123